MSVVEEPRFIEGLTSLDRLSWMYFETGSLIGTQVMGDFWLAWSHGTAFDATAKTAIDQFIQARKDDETTGGKKSVPAAAAIGLLHRFRLVSVGRILGFIEDVVRSESFDRRSVLILHVFLRSMESAMSSGPEDITTLEIICNHLADRVAPQFQESATIPLADKVVFTPILNNSMAMLRDWLEAFRSHQDADN